MRNEWQWSLDDRETPYVCRYVTWMENSNKNSQMVVDRRSTRQYLTSAWFAAWYGSHLGNNAVPPFGIETRPLIPVVEVVSRSPTLSDNCFTSLKESDLISMEAMSPSMGAIVLNVFRRGNKPLPSNLSPNQHTVAWTILNPKVVGPVFGVRLLQKKLESLSIHFY